MPSILHAKHLALLRRHAKVLRAAKGAEQGAFLLVRNRETDAFLLHLAPDEDPSVFRNPAHIWRRLKRLKPLKPEAYADFFANPRELVSCAGVAYGDPSGSRLLLHRTVRTGKGRDLDLKHALKAMRFLRGQIDKEGPAEEEAPVAQAEQAKRRVAQARDLFGDEAPTAEAVLAGMYEHFGSLDGLSEALEALEDAALADPSLGPMRDSMVQAWERLDRWDPDQGIDGVNAGLAALMAEEIGEEDEAEARQVVVEQGIDGIRSAQRRALRAMRTSHPDAREILGDRVVEVSEVLTRVRRQAAGDPSLWAKADRRLGVLRARMADDPDLAARDDGLLADALAWIDQVRAGLSALAERAG